MATNDMAVSYTCVPTSTPAFTSPYFVQLNPQISTCISATTDHRCVENGETLEMRKTRTVSVKLCERHDGIDGV